MTHAPPAREPSPAPCCEPTVREGGFSHEFGFQAELEIDDACSEACAEAAIKAYHDGIKNAAAEGV
jgi:hypothetical protein